MRNTGCLRRRFKTIYNVLSGSDALRANEMLVLASGSLLITESLNDAKQLCGVTENTAVRGAENLTLRSIVIFSHSYLIL